MDKQALKELEYSLFYFNGSKYEVAEQVIKLGYRKIPEGSVVLTKEEYDGLKLIASNYSKAVKEVEARTAEKFAEMLKSMAYQSTDWSHGEHPMVVEVEHIDEVCEEIIGDEK